MFFFFLLLLGRVTAHTRQFVRTCLLSIDPYSSSNSPDFMIVSAATCLARSYIAFPQHFKVPLAQKLNECIASIRETDRSRPEYISLEKTISSITSNLGSSIVEAQHTLENMVYCTEPLKAITNMEVFEESRFDTVAKKFIQQMQKSHHCIHHGIANVETVTTSVAAQIAEFELKYDEWKNISLRRQTDAEECRADIRTMTDNITAYILRE